MDLSYHKTSLSLFRNSINKMRVDLEIGKRENMQLATIAENFLIANEAKTRLINYIEFLKRIKSILEEADDAFKTRRLDELSKEVSNALAVIYPVESFTATLEADTKYRSRRADLVLKHKNGTERIPDVSEGMLLQQLVSFSASLSFTLKMGMDKLYMDEAFSVAYKENLAKLATLVQFALEAGMQIIMIEQSDVGYKHLPRREHRILKDEIDEKVVLAPYVDF